MKWGDNMKKSSDVIRRASIAIVDGKTYTVDDLPSDAKVLASGPDAFKRGVVYRLPEWLGGLYPYRGVVDDGFSRNTSAVGIWLRRIGHGRYEMVYVNPRSKKEQALYSPKNEQRLLAGLLEGDYNDSLIDIGPGTPMYNGDDAYMPPIHADDNALHKLMKIAIRKVGMPLSAYRKRIVALSNPGNKSGATSVIGNLTRRHRNDRAMSADKFQHDATAWGMRWAVILMSEPGCDAPMDLPENSALVVYPNGVPFDINSLNLIDIGPMVAKAVAEETDTSNYLTPSGKDENGG